MEELNTYRIVRGRIVKECVPTFNMSLSTNMCDGVPFTIIDEDNPYYATFAGLDIYGGLDIRESLYDLLCDVDRFMDYIDTIASLYDTEILAYTDLRVDYEYVALVTSIFVLLYRQGMLGYSFEYKDWVNWCLVYLNI